jgi:hypothetical protein
MKKYFFPFLVALAAFTLAGAAAFFSITGLAKLFGGATTAVIIMASSLEFAKLVTASLLHNYWNKLANGMKFYLTTGVIVLMLITSAGIYGFLSSAYTVTSDKLKNIDSKVGLVENKKEQVNGEILRLKETVQNKSSRSKSLIELRDKQENRVDSLYNKKLLSVAKRVEAQISDANKEVGELNLEIDEINKKIQLKYDEISELDKNILDSQDNDLAAEVGPLKFISNLTGVSMEKVVNFFILLLVFVFDPLAVCLVIAFNTIMGYGNDDEKGIEKIEVKEEKKEQIIEVAPEVIEITEPIKEENSISEKEESFNQFLEKKKKRLDDEKFKYIELLDILFKGGKIGIDEDLPSYPNFVKMVDSEKYDADSIKKFLTLCNYLDISKVSGDTKKSLMGYENAKSALENYLSLNIGS